MRPTRILTALTGLAAAAMLVAGPASAAPHTWVSGTGNDANPCSRTAPCLTFAGAFAKTAAYGEISCLDPGEFGPLTITQSVTINCKAGAITAGTDYSNGIFLLGAGDVVIRGLSIDGPGLNGIRAFTAVSLTVEQCSIKGFDIGIGVDGDQPMKVAIIDTTAGNGDQSGSIGILVSQYGNLTGPDVSIRRVLVSGAQVGIFASGVNSSPERVAVSETESVQNAIGFENASGQVLNQGFPPGGAASAVTVVSSTASQNSQFGVTAWGDGPTTLISNSAITENQAGVSQFLASLPYNFGEAFSYQDNLIDANGATGHDTDNGGYSTAPLH